MLSYIRNTIFGYESLSTRITPFYYVKALYSITHFRVRNSPGVAGLGRYAICSGGGGYFLGGCVGLGVVGGCSGVGGSVQCTCRSIMGTEI